MILVMTQVPKLVSRRSLHKQIGLLLKADCAGQAELTTGTQDRARNMSEGVPSNNRPQPPAKSVSPQNRIGPISASGDCEMKKAM